MNIRALVMAGLLVAASSFAVHAQPVIVRSVIGSGGNFMSGGTFAMDGTVGQAVIGITSGGSPIITDYQGFWYTLPTSGVKVTNNPGEADGFALEQNYPNPFNPSTTIKFSVPFSTKVTIRVLNLLGEEVYRILDGVTEPAGTSMIEFSADDVLPSGTYVYRMEAGNFVASKKMVLLK